MWEGPQAQARAARLQTLDQIVAALHERYGAKLVAIGLYGSLARGEDGPYSDIELFCVVDIPGTDVDYEWVYGAGKAEINVLGLDVVRASARQVEDNWSLDQGQWAHCRPLFGDLAFFDELKHLALTPDKAAVDAMVAEIVVGELYEWMGKLRNAQARAEPSGLALLACGFVERMAWVLGLVHRHLYRTGMTLLAESRALPDRPAGYDIACEMVMAGDLGDPARVAAALEAAWAGLGPWLAQHGVEMAAATAGPWIDEKQRPATPPD